MRAVLVLAALALAACGAPSTGPALSEGEFVGEASLICTELERRALLADDGLLAAASGTDDGEGRLADARRVVAGFASVVADARAELAELRPPESHRAAAASYLAALDRARQRLDTAGATERATRAFLDAGGEVLAGGLDADEAALGLDACAGGPAAAEQEDETARNALRTTLLTEQLVLAGDGAFSESLDDLRLLQPDGRYEVGLEPTTPATVHVRVANAGAVVFLSARSRSGTCFYVVAQADAETGYAQNPSCGPADAQDYQAAW